MQPRVTLSHTEPPPRLFSYSRQPGLDCYGDIIGGIIDIASIGQSFLLKRIFHLALYPQGIGNYAKRSDQLAYQSVSQFVRQSVTS